MVYYQFLAMTFDDFITYFLLMLKFSEFVLYIPGKTELDSIGTGLFSSGLLIYSEGIFAGLLLFDIIYGKSTSLSSGSIDDYSVVINLNIFVIFIICF